MKRLLMIITVMLAVLVLTACQGHSEPAQIAATTLPVYDFSVRICSNTPLQVTRIISQEISCLHDYTLQVSQMRAIEQAQTLVISGAGLEDGLLPDGVKTDIIDASTGIHLLCETDDHDHGHNHGHDPHIWLSIENARKMAENIYIGLSRSYPQYADTFTANYLLLCEEFDTLEQYAQQTLAGLSSRKLVTFHDGFSYMAQAWDLELLHALEEESGSEASAGELIELCALVRDHNLPAIFTEKGGSVSAAQILTRETGVPAFALDMAMSGDSYFKAMYHNIATLKEALG